MIFDNYCLNFYLIFYMRLDYREIILGDMLMGFFIDYDSGTIYKGR